MGVDQSLSGPRRHDPSRYDLGRDDLERVGRGLFFHHSARASGGKGPNNRQTSVTIRATCAWICLFWLAFLLSAPPLSAQTPLLGEPPEAPEGEGVEEPEAPEEEATAWTEADAQRLDAIREELRSLETVQRVLSWYTHTAGEEVMLADTYHGHDALFSINTLRFLERAIEHATQADDERRALERLRLMIAYHYLTMRVAPFDDRVARTEREARVRVSFQPEPLAYSRLVELAQDPTHPHRDELLGALMGVRTDLLEPLRAEREVMMRSLAVELGFGSYLDLSEQFREVILSDLLTQSVRFLVETDPLHTQLTEQLKAWLPPGGSLRDLLHAPPGSLQRLFPKQEAFRWWKRTLLGMGLEFKTGSGNRIRVEEYPSNRTHRGAFATAPRVPRDVRLTFASEGGYEGYAALFEAGGQAIYYAHVRSAQYEFQHPGADLIPRAAGAFFRQLLVDPDFLKAEQAHRRTHNRTHLLHRLPAIHARDIQRLVTWGAWLELTHLRTTAFAQLTLEALTHGATAQQLKDVLPFMPGVEVATGSAVDVRLACRLLYARARGFALEEPELQAHLLAVTDLLGAADQARAPLLASVMQESLHRTVGPLRFSDAQTGKWLKERWADDASLPMSALMKELGASSLELIQARIRLERLLNQVGALASEKH